MTGIVIIAGLVFVLILFAPVLAEMWIDVVIKWEKFKMRDKDGR